MSDPFSGSTDAVSAPAERCFAITPNDSEALPFITKAIRAGGTGTIVFRAMASDADVTHPVLQGERIDVRATHVRATGTNVTVIGYA